MFLPYEILYNCHFCRRFFGSAVRPLLYRSNQFREWLRKGKFSTGYKTRFENVEILEHLGKGVYREFDICKPFTLKPQEGIAIGITFIITMVALAGFGFYGMYLSRDNPNSGPLVFILMGLILLSFVAFALYQVLLTPLALEITPETIKIRRLCKPFHLEILLPSIETVELRWSLTRIPGAKVLASATLYLNDYKKYSIAMNRFSPLAQEQLMYFLTHSSLKAKLKQTEPGVYA